MTPAPLRSMSPKGRLVQRQKALIARLRAAGVNTLDARRILWLLESNLALSNTEIISDVQQLGLCDVSAPGRDLG